MGVGVCAWAVARKHNEANAVESANREGIFMATSDNVFPGAVNDTVYIADTKCMATIPLIQPGQLSKEGKQLTRKS
jgi:hypothetical protein